MNAVVARILSFHHYDLGSIPSKETVHPLTMYKLVLRVQSLDKNGSVASEKAYGRKPEFNTLMNH